MEFGWTWQRIIPLVFLGFIGPALFLIVPIVYATWVSAFGSLSAETALDIVSGDVPSILLGVQIVLGLITLMAANRVRGVLATLSNRPTARKEIGIGLATGTLLGLLYVFAFAPLHVWLQTNLGDYVPPGEVQMALGRYLFVFAVANVLLAPFVEEILYRGILFQLLDERIGRIGAIFLGGFLFALLHWAGGFWYMVLVGTLAGGLFIRLRLRYQGLLAPIAAHFAVNVVETLKLIT